MRCESELTIFGLQAVDVNRPVGRLSSDKFIEWIPSYALDVVRVLRDLPYHLSFESVSPDTVNQLHNWDAPF